MSASKIMKMCCCARQSSTFSETEVAFSGFNFVIHEGGTAVYDSYDNFVGDYPTESEAVSMIREYYGE